MLRVENIHVRYVKNFVVKAFSFEVAQGEIVSLIGPNGSDKST